eukprot:gnl/MRDRNA2_/MRDRNA2_39597_c0_seq1.p1 gnl/MRDRNA2_/MRDRNA2_39597_c0~~gnl/MRDRNA2_/MRDRNA2_39597_c0_seq1.p1  ORF type:complete len:251 (+),score=65.10 gnl/MRDRNA2_/MRDRNA2_39597_c0_seq1:48-755(+)
MSRKMLPLLASLARKRKAEQVSADQEDEQDEPEWSKIQKKSQPTRDRPAKEKLVRKKGAPLEVSSRRPVHAVKPKTLGKTVHARDPRFSDLSGKLDVDNFSKAYSFLEDYRASEASELKEKHRKAQKRGRREDAEQIATELRRLEQQDKNRRHLSEVAQMTREVRSAEQDKVRTTGKVPYFQGKGKIRKMVLEKRREEQSGRKKGKKSLGRKEQRMEERQKRLLPKRRTAHASED